MPTIEDLALDVEIEAIRKRCEAATPGPYHAQPPDPEDGIDNWTVETDETDSIVAEVYASFMFQEVADRTGFAKENAEFYAHACTDIPRLLDLLTAERKRVVELRSNNQELSAAIDRAIELGIQRKAEVESLRARLEAAQKVLECIRDNDDSCGCEHDTADCCAKVGEACGYCEAAVYLAAQIERKT